MINRSVLFVLVLLLTPLAQAEPLATSYWGYVTDDGLLKPGASVTVQNAAGSTVVSATATQDGLYQVTVPWDDPATNTTDEGVVDGETITFKIDGKAATSRVIDAKGTNNRLDLAASTSTTTSSSSGGGGGGGVSGEDFANIESKEKHDQFISRDKVTSYRFNNGPVLYVNITGNTSAGDTSVSLELLKNTSTLVKTPAPGKVYKNLNLWVGSSGFAVPKNIKEAVITFRVENAWITSGGFKDTDIVLLRWDGAQWISLETIPGNKDGTFAYYEAETNAFSPFAISSMKGEAKVTAAPVGAETPAEPASQEPDETKSTPGFGIVIAIAAFCAVFILRKKKG